MKRLLAEDPPTAVLTRRFPPYQQIADAAEARLAIIRLHAEGWNIATIAAYLHIRRATVMPRSADGLKRACGASMTSLTPGRGRYARPRSKRWRGARTAAEP